MNNNYTGVLLGVVEDQDGKPYFALDIAGSRIVLEIPKAALVYDQLGTLLEMFGWFEQHPEYEEAVKQLVKGAKKCH
jgi:hypothetical protein